VSLEIENRATLETMAEEEEYDVENQHASHSNSNSFLYRGNGEMMIRSDEARHIIIDQAVSRIEYCAFHGWESVVAVYLPQGLRSIGARSFEDCTSLASISIPGTVLLVGISAFEGCIQLMTVGLGEGIAEIGPHAFAECRSLKSIYIPPTVEKIGNSAFEHCVSLKDVGLSDACTTLPYNVFKNCSSLAETFLSPAMNSIGSGAYMSCERICFINLPQGLEYIFCYCFVSCTALKNIHIPSSIKVIDYEAFRGCISLLSVEIPAKVDSVGNGAFLSCRSLCHVAIDSDMDVSAFADGVFENCDKLTEMLQDNTVNGLKERFSNLPVHQVISNQSYREKNQVTLRDLRQAFDSADNVYSDAVDRFGMNPFHILALASDPQPCIFKELMKVYPARLLSREDQWGNSPIYYLSANVSSNATKLLHVALRSAMETRLEQLKLLLWRQDILLYLDAIQLGNTAYRVRQIGRLFHRLMKYERIESISLLEEALWKMKILENQALSDEEWNFAFVDTIELHRGNCRISCGSDIVISNVLDFLPPIDANDYAWFA